MLIAFHKPFGVLSQFTAEAPGQRTLAAFGFPARVYPLGRLDSDSEGLLLLSDEPRLNDALLRPQHGHRRRYWAQVERVPEAADLARLSRGVRISTHQTMPCRAWVLELPPDLPPREPPIRFRKNVPACWIALELTEGKNRQVRRMTAAIGYPTLRLIRVQIGDFCLQPLESGGWKILSPPERQAVFA
jgi:23S rRNA pseudouridine2457 synthase